MTEPKFYGKPVGHRHRLEVDPELVSWDKAGSPGQARVHALTRHVCSVAADSVAATGGGLAVGLDVGLPDTTPLLALNDLDNYLFPLVQALARSTARNIVSAWASKRHAGESYPTIGQAARAPDPGGACAFSVETSVSYAKSACKELVRNQVAGAKQLPDGGVALQVAFAVGPDQAWPNLWKPTIDALGPILGRDDGAEKWNVRDGRITELGMHCVVDPDRRHDVGIAIRASAAAGIP